MMRSSNSPATQRRGGTDRHGPMGMMKGEKPRDLAAFGFWRLGLSVLIKWLPECRVDVTWSTSNVP